MEPQIGSYEMGPQVENYEPQTIENCISKTE